MYKLALLLLPLSLSALEWRDLGQGQLQLQESGTPYLVYNTGPQGKPGVPEDRRRCCYIFPAYTPQGVNPLDDFPKDHYHHRGLFWGWPGVEVGQTQADNWMMKGIETRFVRRHAMHGGVLEVENGWFVGEKKVVRETVKIEAQPTQGASRAFTLTLTLEATNEPVTLSGSHEAGKSYGGFSARFAPREQTKIQSSDGEITRDEDRNPHRWAEMTAKYNGRQATLRITPDGAPMQWCLRQYGFVGASFPGRDAKIQSHTLHPGQPLKLRFTVTLSD